MAVRNAASVLPEPVGAAISVCRPAAIDVPAAQLRGRRLADFGREPLTDDGMETSESHDCWRSGKGEKIS